MSSDPLGCHLRFGEFDLDLPSAELYKRGHRIRIPHQSVQVLAVLLERPGEVVTREELYRKLWPDDVFVDFEHSLNSAVKKLRQSLSDSAETPKFIETLSRRGYRFVGTLEATPSPTRELLRPEPAQPSSPMSAPSRRPTLVWAVVSVVILISAGTVLEFRARLAGHHSGFDRISISRVTAKGNVTAAAISPDGRYVVYAASDAGRESLRMRQLATAAESEMIPAGDFSYGNLTFSPDGNLIYYLKQKGGSRPALYSKAVLGGAESKIMDNVPGHGSLSPDGKSFAFIRNFASGESELIVAGLDGSGERKLAVRRHPAFYGSSSSRTRPGVPYLGVGPAWSPDGKIIACPAGDFRGFLGYIVTVPVNGGAEKTLTRQKWYGVQALRWLRSGEGLVAVVYEEIGSASQLRYISYPDGGTRNVTSDLNAYSSVSLTVDSSALVTLQSTTVSDLWIVPGGKAADARQLGAATPQRGPRKNVLSWTPDGHVVYVSRASGNHHIWIAESDGSNARQLTWFGRYNLQPQVCADGRYVLFSSDRAGNLNIWRMNIDGSNWKQLTFGEAESRPVCSPDGRWVYYTSHAAVPRSVWKVPIDGGAPIRLIDGWSVTPAVSPDGKWVAFSYWEDKFPGQRLAMVRSDVQTPPKVFDFDAEFARWTGDSRCLLYLRRDRGVDNIWRQPIDGGSPVQLTDFKTGLIFNFDWSRDGKQLACARGYEQNDIVLIRDLR